MTELLSPQQITNCQKIFSRRSFRLETINLELLTNQISGTEKQFVQDHLSTSEQERFFSFKYLKRQIEWLGGRLAAKQAISKLLTKSGDIGPTFPALSVDANREGRPVLHVNKVRSSIDISISHSDTLAAALAVSHNYCGIDIQKVTKQIIKVKSHFTLPAEEQIIRQLPCLSSYSEETVLTLLWSAKEAFRKSVVNKPVLGFLNIRLQEITGSLRQGFTGTFTCQLPTKTLHLKSFLALSDTFAVAIT